MLLRTAEIIKKHEGVRSKVYFCPAGQLTVGAGRNIQAIPFSDDEIDLMLKNDIERVTDELDRRFVWFQYLTGARRDALICIAYNLGLPRLLSFKKALRSMAESKWSESAHHFRDSRWARQVKLRAVELTQMIETNEYQ